MMQTLASAECLSGLDTVICAFVPPSRRWAGTGSVLDRSELQHHQGLVVHALRAGAERLKVADAGVNQLPRVMAMAGFQQPAEALVTILRTVAAGGFREPVGVDHQAVA